MPDDLSIRHSSRNDLRAALLATRAGAANAGPLREASERLGDLAGGSVEGDAVWALAQMVECLAMAVQWQPAILAADPSPTRFRDAARQRAIDAMSKRGDNPWPQKLLEVAAGFSSLDSLTQVKTIVEDMLVTPLPVRITGITEPQTPTARRSFVTESSTTLAVLDPVLVLISVDDRSLETPLAVRQDQIYALSLRVRAVEWPEDATALHVEFVSVLPSSTLELRPLRIARGAEQGTTLLQFRGALGQGRSQEVVLRASYEMGERRQHVTIVGTPRFRLASFDPATSLPLSMPMVAQKLIEMIGALDAKLPKLPVETRSSFFTLFESTLRYSQRAVHDTQLAAEERIPEAEFQRHLIRHLNADPAIGARLKEAPKLGGGITDLVLDNVVLELKIEHDRAVALQDASRYMSQPAHYSAHADCPVSILCILDDSEKLSPPGGLNNYFEWLVPSLHGSQILHTLRWSPRWWCLSDFRFRAIGASQRRQLLRARKVRRQGRLEGNVKPSHRAPSRRPCALRP